MRLISDSRSPTIDLTNEESDDEGGSASSRQTLDLEDDDNIFIAQSPGRAQIRYDPGSRSTSIDLTMMEDESTGELGSLQGEAPQSPPSTIYTPLLAGTESTKRKLSPSEHSSSSGTSSTGQKRQKSKNTMSTSSKADSAEIKDSMSPSTNVDDEPNKPAVRSPLLDL